MRTDIWFAQRPVDVSCRVHEMAAELADIKARIKALLQLP
jgi:hypothetical protein